MFNQKKFIVSHAPFLHNGSCISQRSYHTILAAMPAVIVGLLYYGMAALAVICLSVSSAVFWELAFTRIAKRPDTIGDGTAALIGLLFGMMLPAGTPWWIVLTGTLVAVVIGKQIFGGIGANPFNPVVVSVAILTIAWGSYLDFDAALTRFDLNFDMFYPLGLLKHHGPSEAGKYVFSDLLMGKQAGGIGSTFGLGLIVGGVYLIIRGFIRWEIVISFLAGIVITALIFNQKNPDVYAGPMIHLLTGYTLIGAFFLATDDASSPVNFVPMLLYGAVAGFMTILIRNIGVYVDGVVFAILIVNIISPLLDKIRPKAMGKVV